jgi:hypothetical protein
MVQYLGPSSLLAQISTLRFPPGQFSPLKLREVFNRLSQVGTFNYLVAADKVELITPSHEGGGQVKIVLGKEAVQVSFDPTTKPAELVGEELVVILREVTAVLAIPVFVHQTHVLRKTMPLPSGVDARSFILEKIVNFPPGGIAGWKRGFASVGIRFVFPPQEVNELSAHDLKVESFLPDPNKVLVEDTASYLTPLPAGQWDSLKANLQAANRFIDEYVAALLRPRASPGA